MSETRVRPRRKRSGHADDTRQRILAVARELFARQGYTGTTIADIARPLGITTAALYYHFTSKADILDSLLAKPLAAYTELIEHATTQRMSAETLLSAYIDFAADTRELIPVVSADPAIRAMLDERLPRKPQEMTAAIIAALAGPRPSRSKTIRAHAAFAVAKEATLAAASNNNRKPSPSDRKEVLEAALRALGRPQDP